MPLIRLREWSLSFLAQLGRTAQLGGYSLRTGPGNACPNILINGWRTCVSILCLPEASIIALQK